jgi:hypothetical protein
MLSDQQKLLLKTAANAYPKESKEQRDAVDQAIRLVKIMTPNSFYPDVPHSKPTKEMQERVFFDEPNKLQTANYASYVVPYSELGQVARFKHRDSIYIPGGKK